MKKTTLFLLLTLLLCGDLISQNLSAYTDRNDNFYIFDNGTVEMYESLKPISYKIGGNCVAYLDNASNFKIYYNGQVITPCGNMIIDNYFVTHNLVLFTVRKTLFVFNNGKTDTIVTDQGYNYKVSDSLVVFQDMDTKSLQVYYKGKIDTLSTPQPGHWGYYTSFNNQYHSPKFTYDYELSRNIVAFMDSLNFKVFYQGKLYTLFTLPEPLKINSFYPVPYAYRGFQCGNNIVSYVDPLTKKLNVFYKGLVYELPVKYLSNFNTGDDMVAYKDSLGLHVFYAGKSYDLLSSSESMQNRLNMSKGYDLSGNTLKNNSDLLDFIVKDSVLIYYSNKCFNVFSGGTITKINDSKIGEYEIDNGLLAWMDVRNNLNALYKGNIYTLSTLVPPVAYTVGGNTIWFNLFPNDYKFFCRGTIY